MHRHQLAALALTLAACDDPHAVQPGPPLPVVEVADATPAASSLDPFDLRHAFAERVDALARRLTWERLEREGLLHVAHPPAAIDAATGHAFEVARVQARHVLAWADRVREELAHHVAAEGHPAAPEVFAQVWRRRVEEVDPHTVREVGGRATLPEAVVVAESIAAEARTRLRVVDLLAAR